MKKIAVGNVGEEEVARLTRVVLTREDTKSSADQLFGGEAKNMRKQDRELLEKLFIQTPASNTMAPNLQKEASVSARVDAFFEKLSAPTVAQQRYPELLKAAEAPSKKVISVKPRVTTDTSGPIPTRSSLSGGSA